LIPSPTGYEPREFLLAVFQRIAEHAKDKARTVIERAESLTVLATRRTRQLWLQLVAIVVGVSVASAATLFVMTAEGGRKTILDRELELYVNITTSRLFLYFLGAFTLYGIVGVND
jgi:hypothetical protein